MNTLILPALVLAVLAIALPFGWARLLPEGAGWLMVNAALSALVLFGVALAYFVVAYSGLSPRVLELLGATEGSARHFLRLGALSALIWGPVMVLAVAAQPKRWKDKVW